MGSGIAPGRQFQELAGPKVQAPHPTDLQRRERRGDQHLWADLSQEQHSGEVSIGVTQALEDRELGGNADPSPGSCGKTKT